MINFRKCLKLWTAHPCRCFVAALPCVPPSPSHLCNSISVLQWALIDLFRRSTKWLAKSPPPPPPPSPCSCGPLRPAGGTLSLSCFSTPRLSLIPHSATPVVSSLSPPADTARESTPQLKAEQTTRSELQRRGTAGRDSES